MQENKHIFTKTILKEYDIRGIVDKDLNEIDAYFIGRGYGTLLKRKYQRTSCVVGYDGRHTSPLYSENLVKGLVDTGIAVTNIGLVSTPMVYFAVQFFKKDAGIIVTASHNPSDYNGFKMLTNEEPIWGDDIQKIGVYAKNGDFESGNGIVENMSVNKDYYDFIWKNLKDDRNKRLKIAWDAGNGAVASVLNDIVSKFPDESITICDVVDGNFPNHHPDPAVEKNMTMLKDVVLKNSCDFGVGFDGDGDRIGIIDDKGNFVYGDQLLAILAREFLKDNPGEKVMSEVKASKVLYDDITKHGGIPVMWKPGHSAQKAKMKSDNIKLAGETSGHMFYGDNYNYDDAMYAAVKLINFMSDTNMKISDIINSFPKTYSTKEVRVEVGDERKFKIINEIASRMELENRNFIDIDGVRTEVDDGWWLARASNTQPDITTRCEALSESGLEKCKKDLLEQLKLSGVNAEF